MAGNAYVRFNGYSSVSNYLRFLRSLPQLYIQRDVLFLVDYEIFISSVKAWYSERPGEFDYFMLSRIDDALD